VEFSPWSGRSRLCRVRLYTGVIVWRPVIVVCGEALIDVIRNRDSTERAAPGGGPFNTTRALARLGVPTAFLGHLSDDQFGRELSELLVADGASVALASVGPEPTTVAHADVDSRGAAEYQFVVDGTSAPNLTAEMLPASFAPDVNGICVGSLGLVLEPMAGTVVELVRRERGRRLIMLDPNIRVGLVNDLDNYRARLLSVIAAATVVKASDSDLAWIEPESDYRSAAQHMLDQGVRMVAITLGAQGAFGAHRDLQIHVPAPPVQVVDTIGAGDAFGAGLLAWLHDHDLIRPDLKLDEKQLQAGLDYACLAAALTCTRAGADPPWKREMTRA
jgi:fructokinase